MSGPATREGPSLRPGATFIWLEFQELKSNIPVGKRMAWNPSSEVRGQWSGALRMSAWVVNDGNADQAEEIEMGPAGLP